MSRVWTVDRKTRSYTYIFPMLGSNYLEYPDVVNCYVGDLTNPDVKDHIFLLMKFGDHSEKRKKILQIDSNYVGHYSITEEYEMYYFKIPEKWRSNYFLFKMGKYSKFLDTYKKHILRFHNIKIRSQVGDVLYRSEKLFKEWEKRLGVDIDREQEIGTLPDLKNVEQFSLEMLVTPNELHSI